MLRARLIERLSNIALANEEPAEHEVWDALGQCLGYLLAEELRSQKEIPQDCILVKCTTGKMRDAVKHLEITMIRNALKETDNNRSQTAKLLCISRAGLLTKLKEYGLE